MNVFAAVSHSWFIRTAVWLSFAALINTALPRPARAAEEIGLAPVALGPGPYCFDTAEQHLANRTVVQYGSGRMPEVTWLRSAAE